MNDSSLALQHAIQQSLQDIATQMGEPLDDGAPARLYQESCELLSHISYEALTLARVAGTLLVYQMQKVEAEELAWFRTQVQQCADDEEVEELIESIHRTDAL